MKTVYGEKRKGVSEFVILAPHAGGDDLKTSELAIKIANKLNGSYVINKKFTKPTNKRNKDENYSEDFNSLPILKSGKYNWGKKKLAMKQFYLDAQSFCKKDSLILIIHGMKDKKDSEIDIGIGFIDSGFLFNFFKKKNTSCDLSRAFKLKKKLNRRVRTTIGKYFNAKPKENAVHFFNCETIQLEFSRSLRKNIENTTKIICEAIKP